HMLRHPRSAIGFLDEHTLILMVIDGRQKASVGVTLEELAEIMFKVGCHDAVNLDGGGSSVMVAADEVVNVPTDVSGGNQHSLRRNASALVLVEDVPSSGRDIKLIDTDSEYYSEHGIWRSTNHPNYYGNTPSREAVANETNRA